MSPRRDVAGAHAIERGSRRAIMTGATLVVFALLSGCAQFSPDAGMGAVAAVAEKELQKDVIAIQTPDDAELARAAVERMLKRALTADAAVQIALINNRGLQAAYAELAAAEAR